MDWHRKVNPVSGLGKKTGKKSCKFVKQDENEQNYIKKPHPGRGLETIWAIPVSNLEDYLII